MTDLDRRVLLGLAGLAGAAAVTQLSKAGSLNPPPGPVAPTGKTTDQIEPRIDLLNAPASANVTSDANRQYIINNPGSYFLSGNIVLTKSVGIRVQASGVTLDLQGFEIAGPGSTGTAIQVAPGVQRVGVSDGTLHGLLYGIDASQASACRFSRLIATQCAGIAFYGGLSTLMEFCVARSNSGSGFLLYSASVLTDCVAESNAAGGIQIGDSSILARCVAYDNTGSFAIISGSGCAWSDCQAMQNGTSALPMDIAIYSGDNCVLTRCSANGNYVTVGLLVGPRSVAAQCIANDNVASNTYSAAFWLVGSAAHACTAARNTTTYSPSNASTGAGFACLASECSVEECTAFENSGDGICLGDLVYGSSVSQCRAARCAANENGFDGIRIVGSDAAVADNRCIKNGGSGVHVQSGSSNIIERNQTLGNTANGVQIDSTLSLVHGNSARGNGAVNYLIVAGNRVGTIVVPATNAAISGNAGGTTFTTDPYANIAF